jgi:hypothetical protein
MGNRYICSYFTHHNHNSIHTTLAQHNYIAAAITSDTPTTGINKTTSIVKGYHDRSIPTGLGVQCMLVLYSECSDDLFGEALD